MNKQDLNILVENIDNYLQKKYNIEQKAGKKDFDEIKFLLSNLVDLFKKFKIEIPKEVKISNLQTPEIKITSPKVEVPAPIVNVPAPIVNVKSPIVNVPAPVVNVKPQDVKIPAPIVNITEKDYSKSINTELKSIQKLLEKIKIDSSAENPVAVRLSDGEEFYKALSTVVTQAMSTGGGSRLQFKKSNGEERQARLSNDENLIVVAKDGTDFFENTFTAEVLENPNGLPIRMADGPSVDAFSRIRASEPSYVFDTNFQYDLQPLVFEQITAETGATVSHDTTNRNALMTFSSTPTNGKAYMQSYEWFRYQAGRSQMIILTFNFIETATNTTKFIGYSDGNNGIELQQVGSTAQITLYSDTGKGDETVTKANWNIDPMDGTGPSGITINFTKTQIFFIDFQWLGVGRIRCGFDIDGVLYYVHEFKHANIQSVAYMQTANLPIRAGMTCSGSSTTTMRFICASVSSEGGETDIGGYNFSVEGNATASNGARTHILSLRPKITFNSIANRTKFILESVEVLATGNNPVYWELCIGQAISGTTTFSDVNANYSGMQYNTAGTISGSPTIVIASGYVAASNQARSSNSRILANKYPITLDQAGAVRLLGTMSIIARGLGADTACRASLNWREIR